MKPSQQKEAMDVNAFPNRPARPGSPTPPATIDNVAFLLDHAGISCRYNTVKKKVEIDIPAHAGTSENRDNVTLTAIVSLASQHGMPVGQIGHYVDAIADRNAYNPVAHWINSKPWDGVDRLPDICATVVETAGYSVHLKRILLHKWLRSAAAAMLKPGYKGRGVLTFQGPQGIGKTSWVKALVSDPVLRDSVVKLDHHMDTSNKDSLLGGIENWIVEIGELDSSFKKDVARLKGFITSDSDRVRRPYGRRECEYPRQTLFVATVNDPAFLVDTTGNSRWWTIGVDKLDYQHNVDMQQLFAQMATEVVDGEKWWLNEHEEALLADWNAQHTATSVVADMLLGWIETDPTQRHKLSRVTATEALRIAGIDRPTNPQAKEAAALLRELLGPPTRVQGRMVWKVPFREPTAADLIDERGGGKRVRQLQEDEIFD